MNQCPWTAVGDGIQNMQNVFLFSYVAIVNAYD